MSDFHKIEHGQVTEYNDNYYIDCPYCDTPHAQVISTSKMPWNTNEELDIVCPYCGKHFDVRPKYKFEGFFVYSIY